MRPQGCTLRATVGRRRGFPRATGRGEIGRANLFFRLLWHALAGRRRPPVDILGACRTPFRVWSTDLDVLRHVNNGVYLSIMDLARVDLVRRAGLAPALRERGWYPVVAAQTIQFRRSLTLLQRFVIETRVLGWDDRAFLLEQRFLRRGRDGAEEVVAIAAVRGAFLARGGGGVAPAALLDLAGHREPSPALPDWVARWNETQLALRSALRGEGATTA